MRIAEDPTRAGKMFVGHFALASASFAPPPGFGGRRRPACPTDFGQGGENGG